MNFHFRLLPVDDVAPWHTKLGRPTLSWFGLTLGYFWITIDGQELFRYSSEALAYWQRLLPRNDVCFLPYEDYQVARYWEDLLQMLPVVLDPLPADFAARMDAPHVGKVWQDEAYRWQAGNDEDESACDSYDAAVAWHRQRMWDAAHLAYPPRIWLWCVENTVHARWDNRDITVDGLPVWEAKQGECTLPVSEFLTAFQLFNDRFLAEMQGRVNELVSRGGRSHVEIDLAALLREQSYRLSLMKPAITPWVARVRRAFSWEETRDAIHRIEKEIAHSGPLL